MGFFVVYVMILSVAHTTKHQRIELMSNELERIWKEAAVA
jgi:hypothetical protein